MTKDTGGQAFPQSGACGASGDNFDSADFGGSGMTLRDYFAGQTLVGAIGVSAKEALNRISEIVDEPLESEKPENQPDYCEIGMSHCVCGWQGKYAVSGCPECKQSFVE